MSSRVFSNESAKQIADQYVSQKYGPDEQPELSVLRLKSTWLVECHLASGPSRARKVLMMVNRHGFVEELSTKRPPTTNESPLLAGLRRANEIIDLRESLKQAPPAPLARSKAAWWS